MPDAPQRLLLIGGGHTHIEVLRQLAQAPEPDVALTLVSPGTRLVYSGMLPGLVAGHYTADESHIALAPLARAARAEWVDDRAIALDPATRTVTLASGIVVAFDVASIDIGSTPQMTVPGARRHAISVRPFPQFLTQWEAIIADRCAGRIRVLAVVGGGAGGVELLLAMHYRLQKVMRESTPKLALVSDRWNLPAAVQRRMSALLAIRNIEVHIGSGIAAVDKGALTLQSGERIRADRIVWATSAAAAPWLAASGVACDKDGFIRVNDYLQSPSHPFIFAAGDCASQDGRPHPKSGVFAVRQGPSLTANLRHALRAEPMVSFVPQRRALALISTGDKNAIAVYGRFALAGQWVWRWKNRIDCRFVAKYKVTH